jgi:ABC-type branched-subunit amino acid transport system substrate-binding protein
MKKQIALVVGVALVFALATVLLTAAPGAAQTKGGKTLEIGALMSTSGWHTVIDAIDEHNLQIMAGVINDKGGVTVKGEKYKIKLIVEDTKSTMEGVRAAATRLAFDKKVKFVVGPNSFFTPGATPVFTPNKILSV